MLEQRFHHVEKERDELYEKFESAIYDVQQKSGFRNLLFEKKLDVYGEELEKTEGQLNHLIHSFNVEPQSTEAAQQKVEDILTAKNDAIKERLTKRRNNTRLASVTAELTRCVPDSVTRAQLLDRAQFLTYEDEGSKRSKAEQVIRKRSLDQVFGKMKKSKGGGHKTTKIGSGVGKC